VGSPQVGALNIFENFQVSHFHTLSSHFLVHIKNTCCTEIALNVKELEELVLNGFLDFHKPCYACITFSFCIWWIIRFSSWLEFSNNGDVIYVYNHHKFL